MDAPNYPESHDNRLQATFPYAFYVWNRLTTRFELWCDEGKGAPPYKAMILKGPEGEFREPGDWVIDHLRYTDPDSGHKSHRHSTAGERQEWVRNLTDRKYLNGIEQDRRQERMEQLRDEALHVSKNGRVFGAAHAS